MMKRGGFTQCPVCGSEDIAEYDIVLTIFHGYVCRKCLTEWDDSPFGNVDYKPAVPVRISKRESQEKGVMVSETDARAPKEV